MSESLAVEPPPISRRLLMKVLRRVAVVLGVSLLLGAIAGVVWWAATPLPNYQVADDGYASISERGLAQVFAADAWFTGIGLVVGAIVGAVGARLLGRRIGWLVVLVVIVDALIAAGVCLLLGQTLGPSDFEQRLANASPGDLVPIDLTLRSWVAFAVWPFFALLPVLLWSTLARDPEEPRPIRMPWRSWSAASDE